MATHDFTLDDVKNVVNDVVTDIVSTAIVSAKHEIIATVHQDMSLWKSDIISSISQSKREIIKTVTEDIAAEGRRIDRLEIKVDNLDHSLRAHISDPRAHRFG